MARPPGAKEPDPVPSLLPAPYAPPWLRLGDDLRAMAAWLQLKLRELWRRNWQGNLPLPGFWPRPWSQLFWPVVLGGVLLAGFALGKGLLASSGGRAGVKPEAHHPAALLQDQDPKPSPEEGNTEAMESSMEPPLRPPEPPAPATENPTPKEEAELEASSAQIPSPLVESPTESERLLAQFGEDRENLLEGLRVEAATATLVVELTNRFAALPAQTRQDWADRWQLRAGHLGYDHLELRDGEQRLIGRDAQVGGGMILLLPRGRFADAGGSPSQAGEADQSDGDVWNQAQRAGGALGTAPDGLASRGSGGRGRWRVWRPDGVTDGGEHG